MTLHAFLAEVLAAKVDERVRRLAAQLAGEAGADAVLFYGSNLRTGDLDGVLDFYVLTPGPIERGIWPTVSYREVTVDGVLLRAKIATMTRATFAHAASGRTLDTTIWARFVQPSALLWSRDRGVGDAVVDAVATAATTAVRYAAALGPAKGEPTDFWRALFQATYRAELRVDRRGRHDQLIACDRAYYERLLPLGLTAAGVPFATQDTVLSVTMPERARRRWQSAWTRRRLLGKPINVLRLIRATTTFDGAARYGAWKIERHTGIRIALSPWRERHPVLAAPGALWQVWRHRAP